MKTMSLLLAVSAFAQQAPPPPPPQSYPVTTTDESGYESIFDGKTLNGWEGDPKYWRVENGAMVGEITPETIVKYNTFLIWRGGVTKDFDLKVEYRITEAGNSGVNYRSVELPGVKHVLKGYQADIDGRNRYTGQNYEERGRTFNAMRGQITRILPGKKAEVIGTVGDAAALAAFIKSGDWNEYQLIGRGNTLVHILNGHVMSMVIDDDPENRKLEGLLGVQVHVGPPMKVEYRNWRLKRLP